MSLPQIRFLIASIALVCTAAVFLAFVVLTLDHIEGESQKERYPAWVKLTGRTDITYEEFQKLDKAGYLKGSHK